MARALTERLPVGHEVAICRRSMFQEPWSGKLMWSTFGETKRLRLLMDSYRPNKVVVCWAPGRGGDHRKTYVEGMKCFLESAENSRPHQVIYTSSSAVVEGQSDGAWLGGEGELEKPTGQRAINLWEAESLLSDWGKRVGCKTLILRLSGLFGRGVIPGKRLLEKGDPLEKSPEGWVNLIHLDDAAEAVRVGMEKNLEGGWVVTSTPVNRRDLYSATAETLGLKDPRWSQKDGDRGKRLDGSGFRRISGMSLNHPSPVEWLKEGV